MKKILVVVLAAVMVAGCGGEQKNTGYQGAVTDKKDFIGLGMKYLEEGEAVKAIQSFDMAIRQDPRNPENYMVLGQVYLKLKQFPQAIDTFTAASEVAPNNGDILYFLALSRALDGRKEKAIEAAQASVNLFVKNRNEEGFKKAAALLQGLQNVSEDQKTLTEAPMPAK